ncbi:MAG: bifunctional adenosylcobinamide kinase/adenosylcobinamide-phosphate guanylyltransferase, partial [Gordonia sp. (in: high G+C Gram-positive bacteria)]|uniref:bifunctional adenosylcobinamide kinase/adenosylcobinamide-phosphate guanylyltransferase n=1 Tax=Gordonia sp. (in: high G+C Gram-positive bacteria) TaxID=84139 RepID=UPI003BB5103A
MRTLVLGGIRSGKSARAETLLDTASRVRYLATGAAPDDDDDDPSWAQRVAAHRARRGDRYHTVETIDLAAALRADQRAATVIDDLGNWVTRLLDDAGWDRPDVDLSEHIDDLAAAVAAFRGDLVIVSPEVGLSVVPAAPAGRRFADVLGAANQAIAAACDNVELIVAGRILTPTAYSEGLVSTCSARSTNEGNSPVEPVEERARAETTPPTEFPLNPIDAEIFDVVDLPNDDIAEQTRQRLLTLTKPPGSLGRLEDLGVWIAACQGACPPRRLESPQIVVFAGDHGVARDGVSAFPPEVTAQMVTNIVDGGAAINVLARRTGAGVQVLD